MSARSSASLLYHCHWHATHGVRAINLRSHTISTSSLPRVLQPSTWRSIIPTFLRRRPDQPSPNCPPSPSKKPTTNPASYFIWIYLFIGSQAIRTIQIQNEHATFARRAELKIGKLRQVIDRLQKGEDVDVEAELGTGDEAQEKEWEDALREVEEEDRAWMENRRKMKEQEERERAEGLGASPVNEAAVEKMVGGGDGAAPARAAPGFY